MREIYHQQPRQGGRTVAVLEVKEALRHHHECNYKHECEKLKRDLSRSEWFALMTNVLWALAVAVLMWSK